MVFIHAGRDGDLAILAPARAESVDVYPAVADRPD